MNRGPQRLVDDPAFAELFEGLAQEQGPIEGLPDAVRRDVAAMISASVAGAAGAAALGAVTSGAAPTGGAAVSSGALSTAASSGVASSVGVATGSVATTSAAAAGTGVVSGGVAATTAGGLSAATGLGAASASLAALGVVPKVIAAVSLVGAVTAGGVVASRSGPAHLERSDAVVETTEHAPGEVVSSRGVAPVAHRAEDPPATEAAQPSEDAVPLSEITEGVDEDARASEGAASEGPRGHASKGTPSQAPSSGGGLAGEVSLLQKARASIRQNPERAWMYLNAYHQRYPRGALRSEYETLVRRAQTTQLTPPSGEAD